MSPLSAFKLHRPHFGSSHRMSSPSPFKQLSNLISASVDQIESHYKSNSNLQYPSLDAPFDPTSPSEALSMDPAVIPATMVIVSACAQLSATVNLPAMTMYDAIGGFHLSSVLRAALEANVVEILRGHPQGLHVRDIAAQNEMEPVKLGRVLRLLATHHIFNEMAPDTFSNNRISSMMDTLKSVDEIKASPENKHVRATGVSALLEHSADEVFKSSAYLAEVLLDKQLGHSDDHKDCPFSYAFKTDKSLFDWYEELGNEFRLKRFSAAMEGAAKLDPPNATLAGFQWGSLANGSVVVDVGGGMGHSMLKVHKEHPSLKIVVQDRPKVIEQAKQFWSTNDADTASSGSVTLQAQDFFAPQQVRAPAVFMCRMIFYNYGKSVAANILKQLRSAMASNTKLLIIDQIVPYACPNETTQSLTSSIKGVGQLPAPLPLLANLGKANLITVIGDLQMYTLQGGEERTLGSFIDLLGSEGWKIEEVFTIPGSIHKQILAVPI
ncbi:O-methyltransferase [Armillaria borealis]|uniref:O-methyltransferase n=1 Tax=Armillaria borealis TaxID=47425 RepID=A0AA39JBZ0_9AGAR|nr:O-methyltransferase [Armillaria borealis]